MIISVIGIRLMQSRIGSTVIVVLQYEYIQTVNTTRRRGSLGKMVSRPGSAGHYEALSFVFFYDKVQLGYFLCKAVATVGRSHGLRWE